MNKQLTKRNCLNCKKEFIIKGHAWNKKYCNDVCAKEYLGYRGAYKGISTGTVGAIAELEIASDLMKKGYEVFRAISQSCSCDLIILKDGKTSRVEVRSGYRNKTGSISYGYNSSDNGRHDILVLYIHKDNEIIYKPLELM